MTVTARVALLAIAQSALWVVGARAQSAGDDLPPGFRSLAGVTLNRDSAATIRAKLGTARERRSGAGRDALTDWCYVPADGPDRTVLDLMSDASDMGTPGQALNVFRLRADAPAEERRGCAPLPASAQLSTPAGLRLGLRSSEVQELLGAPTRQTADSLSYSFEAKEFLRPDSPEYQMWNTLENRESCFDAGPPYANIEAAVIVLIRDGRAVEIRVERYDRSVC
ncbi:MAG: hypothetical protein ACREN6_06165 [Gemmatimonadaceae bacterium]